LKKKINLLPCRESNQNSSGFLPTPMRDADSHIAAPFSRKKELNKHENASTESPFTFEEKRQDKQAALQTNSTFCRAAFRHTVTSRQ
jgi:hypothetical protein